MKVRILLFLNLVFTTYSYSQPASFFFNVYSQDRKQFSSEAIYFLTDNFDLVKCDYSGNTLWSKSIPGLWNWSLGENSIYFLAGADILSKLDTAGNNIWSKDVSSLLCGQSGALRAVTSSADRIFLYWKYSPTYDALLVLDTAANFINAWCDYSNIIDYEISMLYPDPLGGVWPVFIDGPGNGNYAVVTRLDQNGNPVANSAIQKFNICLDDYIEDILPFSDSTRLLIDNGNDFISPWFSNCGIFKLDGDGNIIHQKIFDAPGDTSFQVARAGIDTLANIYLILSYIENNSGYISMKLDSSLNVLDTKIWPSINTNPLIMDHYDRMVYHNGIFYCPATYYVSWIAQYQSFFLVDTLMTQVCGMTMLPSGVSEKNYQSNQTQWNSVTATTLTPSASSYPLVTGTLPGMFDLCLSITTPEIPLRKRVIVSPNPASGLISIDIEEESSYEIHFLNVTGIEVLFQESISNNLLIDISQLPAGVYFLNYLSARHSFTEKIIKM